MYTRDVDVWVSELEIIAVELCPLNNYFLHMHLDLLARQLIDQVAGQFVYSTSVYSVIFYSPGRGTHAYTQEQPNLNRSPAHSVSMSTLDRGSCSFSISTQQQHQHQHHHRPIAGRGRL